FLADRAIVHPQPAKLALWLGYHPLGRARQLPAPARRPACRGRFFEHARIHRGGRARYAVAGVLIGAGAQRAYPWPDVFPRSLLPAGDRVIRNRRDRLALFAEP